MKVSPPTLIGGILLILTAVLFPILDIFLRITIRVDSNSATLITVLMHPTVYACIGTNCVYVYSFLLLIPEALFVLSGIFGIIGGGTHKKGLKVASGVLGLVGGGVTCFLVFFLNITALNQVYAYGVIDYSLVIVPSYGLYVAFAGGALCLIGLAVKEDAVIYAPLSGSPRYSAPTPSIDGPVYSTTAATPKIDGSWDINAQTASAPSIAAPTAQSSNDMSFCPGCGVPIPPESTFCGNCGTKF
jgi:hypothetical protein